MRRKYELVVECHDDSEPSDVESDIYSVLRDCSSPGDFTILSIWDCGEDNGTND